MDWKISSSVCVLCSRVSQFYINKWVLYGWVVSCVHAYLKGTKSHWAYYALQFPVYCRVKLLCFRDRLVWYGDSPGGFCQQSVECDSRYDWSSCIHNKKRKSSAPHSGLSVNDATKHRQDEFSQLRHALCCLSLSGIRLKSSCIHFFDV